MEYELDCPCCNEPILIVINNDGESSVLCNVQKAQNEEELQKILSDKGIEFGVVKGGEGSE